MEEKAIFYSEAEEKSSKYSVPMTHKDDSYPRVVSQMADMLKKVHLEPNTADKVEVLWMPGPRYSCDPREKLRPFPDPAICLIETEITKCIQLQYLDLYLKEGWQVSKCLSTVLVTATVLFVFRNVKELKISGGLYTERIKKGRDTMFDDRLRFATRQMWGPETFYRLVKRLESHTKPAYKILQKLESVSIRWTTTNQTAFEFLEWLSALPVITFIHADGIITKFMYNSSRILAPKSFSLAKIELKRNIYRAQALQGIFQAARSLECFIYHSTSDFEDIWFFLNVLDYKFFLVFSEFCDHFLKKLQTHVGLSAADSRKLECLTHLRTRLEILPTFGLSGETNTASSLPQSLEYLVLPQRASHQDIGPIESFLKDLVHAKDQHLPSLKSLTLVYPGFDFTFKSDKAYSDWIESATKVLANVGVDFHCVHWNGVTFHGELWKGWTSTM